MDQIKVKLAEELEDKRLLDNIRARKTDLETDLGKMQEE